MGERIKAAASGLFRRVRATPAAIWLGAASIGLAICLGDRPLIGVPVIMFGAVGAALALALPVLDDGSEIDE